MIASGIISRLLGPKVWLGAMLAIVLAASVYVGYSTWKRTNLEVRLNEATVELIRQDARVKRQNDEVDAVVEKGRQRNVDADMRAIRQLTQPTDPVQPGVDPMNLWLQEYRLEE